MPGTPADLVSRSLLVGRTGLSLTYTNDSSLNSRNLVISRNPSDGLIVSRAYPLSSRVLTLERIAHIGRFTSKTQKHTSRNLVIDRVVLGGTLSGTLLYPSAIPTQVQFKPPKYPVTEHPTQSGEVEVQLWSDSNTNATLTLDYTNLSDAIAEQILALWDALYGTYKSLRVPIAMLTGVNQQLAVYMLAGGKNSQWFFAEVPKWVGKIKGYGDLNVILVSQPVVVASEIGGNFPFIPINPISNDEALSTFSDCDYEGQSPDMSDYTYVRWVGTQYQRSGYGGTGGGGPPTTFDVVSGWLPLRTSLGVPVTYGLGGIQLDGSPHLKYSAQYYLGPWYSNIDVYVESYYQNVGVGGSADVFYLYSKIQGQPITSENTNYGMGISFSTPDTFDLARSRGRWEFADASYTVRTTWSGYSRLRGGST